MTKFILLLSVNKSNFPQFYFTVTKQTYKEVKESESEIQVLNSIGEPKQYIPGLKKNNA